MADQQDYKPDQYKRDALFLFLVGVFLTSLVMGNIIGTTKFITLFSVDLPGWMMTVVPELIRDSETYAMTIPAGLLAFPVTFLATDMICELFGRKKAQLVVWLGLFMNVFMLMVMTTAYYLPDTEGVSGGSELFDGVYGFMVGNTIGSMIAYITAQTIDVRLFHFWKNVTKGKHLWLRNNGSTMVSQFVDSAAITSILFFTGNLGENVTTIGALFVLILNAYAFKFLAALFDTPVCYGIIKLFRNYYEDPDGHVLYQPESQAGGMKEESGELAAK